MEKRFEAVINGLEFVRFEVLQERLAKLGYKIHGLENYYNTSNEQHYSAVMCQIKEIDTGLSFASVDARRDESFRALQEIRKSSFSVVKNAILEL